jgi:aminoglycoside phosphotransferase family enzyme/predicted kinase
MTSAALPIQQLLEPAAYSHPTEQPRLLETHISWVVLTGPFAYKIKKPVRYDFLDASTLELRKRYCEEELQLNRRLAADLYLDVVPIAMIDGKLRVNASGAEPIEYAVRMRQFDTQDVLTSLLERQDVRPQELIELARLLAHFHLDAPRSPGNATPQRTEGLFDAVLETSEQLAGQDQAANSADLLARILRWIRALSCELEPTLQTREREQYVRECHGDLHAGNIVRWRNALLPFDGIEFDPALRWIDVMNDVAFLVMDLVSRGRSDLALTLLNSYLEITGDYAGVRLLPFYATYRALVRAKVDALAMQQSHSNSESLRERFNRRIETAAHWISRPCPMLVLMHGVSGSGKSWLSERLVAALPAVRVRSDLERKRLRVEANKDALYTPEMDHRTYARLAECAESCLQAGLNVIVDATFLERTNRDLLRGIARRLRVHCAIVACQASEATARTRVQERMMAGTDISDADEDVVSHQLRHLTPLSIAECHNVVIARTNDPRVVECTVAALRKLL